MKTKAKKFSHKLLALLMAVLMAASCFTGAISAYGATMSSDKTYADDSIEYNDLAWAILSDEQTATALLDYADIMLAEYGPMLDKLLEKLPSSITAYMTWDSANRLLKINAFGIIKYNIAVRTHSVDEIFQTLESVRGVLVKFGGYIGDAKNLNFNSVATNDANGNGWHITRETASSTEILQRVIAILQTHSGDYNGKDVLGQLLRGDFTLGTLGSLANIDVYNIIGGLLGFSDSSYKSNFVYNIVQQLIFQYTNWYTDEEIANFKANPSTFKFDEQLMNKLTTELLDKISVLVTYNQEYTNKSDTSATRYLEIKKEMNAKGCDYATAAKNLGYDPNLVYSDEFLDNDGNPQNVLLFAYGAPDAKGFATSSTTQIALSNTDNLFNFGYQALSMAWNTVLKGTIGLIHVNDSYDEGHGANFDNNYYYYFDQLGKWNKSDVAANYTEAKLNEWANAVYKDYKFDTAQKFLDYVKQVVSYDRTAADDSTGKWSDIDETRLFAKLRYSPLADYGFNVTTGPINLYFSETGTPNVDDFFGNQYKNYPSMVAAFNDALVAVVKDIFPERDNIIGTRPEMATTGTKLTTINDSAIRTVTTTLVGNACKMVQYTADATDANILKAFYTKYGENATLTEKNLEEAMIPMLVACIGQVNLGEGKLERLIHPTEWDGCKDAEAVAYVALKEYLSYSMPKKDYSSLVTIGKDGTINATLEGTILPMARDAVAYVIEAYVPLTDENGNTWKTETAAVNASTTIFDLLNSVICYYGGDYAMQKNVNKGERSMGVGALLGLCKSGKSENGASLITTANTLWQNVDLIANKLMPVLGTLQGKGYAKFDSKDLIWNNVVLSFLNIGDERASGFCGVSNFVWQLLTIVSAEPIQSTPIVTTVYNLVKDLANGLLGARYDGQSFTTIIPDATSATPFDDVLQVKVLAGTSTKSGSTPGAIQKALCNFAEFAGYGTSGVNTYPDSIIRGICFALQAVNSFVPDALSTIGQHQLKMATASFEKNAVTGASVGQPYTTKFNITNNSVGINASYVTNGEVKQLSRYYVKVTDVKRVADNGSTENITGYPTGLIEAGKTASFDLTVKYSPDAGADSMNCEIRVTYDITDKSGNVLYGGNTVSAYQLLTSASGWRDTVYNEDNKFNDAFSQTDGTDREVNGVVVHNADKIGRGELLAVTYPQDMVLGTTTARTISEYGFRVHNNGGNTVFNRNTRSLDGVFFYDEIDNFKTNNLTTAATKFNDDDTTTVKIDSGNAIAFWNKNTGDLLKVGMYDYRIETAAGSGVYGDWQRNQVTEATEGNSGAITYYKGYTEEELATIITNASAQGKAIERRTHVTYTLQEALDAKIIKGYHINENGVYDAMYLQTNGGTINYDNLFNILSLGVNGLDGFYVINKKVTINGGEDSYIYPFAYDNETPLNAGTYNVKLNLYNSSKSGYAKFDIVIGDTSSASSLDTNYNELSKVMANYKSTDFVDQSVYAEAKSALLNVLSVQAAPMTATSAIEMSDTTELTATTKQSTSPTGDRAFVPYSTSQQSVSYNVSGKTVTRAIPASVKDAAYVGGSFNEELGATIGGQAGVYYYDANATMPIYSPKPLTSSDVKDGKDPAGAAVIKGADGNYYLANSVKYATVWDTTTYTNAPWQKPTDTQATDKDNNLLYNQVQYVYRDANGDKCNSTDAWACKFPQTQYTCIANTGAVDESGNKIDYRGAITKANDKIAYVLSKVYANLINASSTLYNNISELRNDLEEVNFDILSYNKMVEYAKIAESKYTVSVEYTDPTTEKRVERNGMSYKDAAALMKSLKNNGTEFTYTTDSDVSSVQAQEAVRLFNIFASVVQERGYQGDKLEDEIKCASGNTYKTLKATPATYNEDGSVKSEAVITKGVGAVEPRFGAWDGNTLSNTGATKFTKASWDAYVRALADAVKLAQYGNGDYKYKNANNFNINDRANYDAQITQVYSVDCALQRAELALTEYQSYTVTVTPVKGAVVTINGEPYTAPVSVETGSTISVNVTAENGYTVLPELTVNGDKKVFEDLTSFPYDVYVDGDVTITPAVESAAPSTFNVTAPIVIATSSKGATENTGVTGTYNVAVYDSSNAEVLTKSFDLTADANEISLDLAPGTYTATITSEFALNRTVTIVVGASNVTGVAVPMIVCDFDSNGGISGTDATYVYSAASKAYNAAFDLDGNGGVTGTDATYVYACAAGTPSFPDITIQ